MRTFAQASARPMPRNVSATSTGAGATARRWIAQRSGPALRLALCRWAYRQPDAVIDAWCATLAHPDSTAAYVAAWCHLNHLREC